MQRIISRQGVEMLSNIRGVIFQLSGTLINPGCIAPFHAMNYALSHSGLTMTNQYIKDNGGPTHVFPANKMYIAELLAHPSMLGQWECIYSYKPRPFDIDRIWSDYIHELEYIAPKYATPTPFAVDLFAALRERGIKIGITTHYSTGVVEAIFDKLMGSGLVFDHIICGSSGKNGEIENDQQLINNLPGIQIYKLLKEWSLPNYEPHHVLHIGSSSSDIINARGAYVMNCQVIDTSNEMGNYAVTFGAKSFNNMNTENSMTTINNLRTINSMNRELLNFRRSETRAKFEVLGADYYCFKLNDVVSALGHMNK